MKTLFIVKDEGVSMKRIVVMAVGLIGMVARGVTTDFTQK